MRSNAGNKSWRDSDGRKNLKSAGSRRRSAVQLPTDNWRFSDNVKQKSRQEWNSRDRNERQRQHRTTDQLDRTTDQLDRTTDQLDRTIDQLDRTTDQLDPHQVPRPPLPPPPRLPNQQATGIFLQASASACSNQTLLPAQTEEMPPHEERTGEMDHPREGEMTDRGEEVKVVVVVMEEVTDGKEEEMQGTLADVENQEMVHRQETLVMIQEVLPQETSEGTTEAPHPVVTGMTGDHRLETLDAGMKEEEILTEETMVAEMVDAILDAGMTEVPTEEMTEVLTEEMIEVERDKLGAEEEDMAVEDKMVEVETAGEVEKEVEDQRVVDQKEEDLRAAHGRRPVQDRLRTVMDHVAVMEVPGILASNYTQWNGALKNKELW